MKKLITVSLLICSVVFITTAQTVVPNNYQQYFDEAYENYPNIPKGVLEAVAYTKTRFNHLDNTNRAESCTGLPMAYGVMGLVENGKGYFQNTLQRIAKLSGYSVNEIKASPRINILAYAKAYNDLLQVFAKPRWLATQASILQSLSELPDGTTGQNYALNAETYAMMWFLDQAEFQAAYGFPNYTIPWVEIFGADNYIVLSSSYVSIEGETIENTEGVQYEINAAACNDYPNSTWVAAHSSNFSSRNGTPVSAVTVHDIEGSYAGAISWFQNPNANVSAHYVLRSIDGQITQMVCEADKGWHVGSENPYTIGLEHEGYYNQTGWYTVAMYTASADLVKDICKDYGTIDNIRTAYWPWAPTTHYNQSGIPGACIRIKGHQHYPNQTHVDPGPNWNWDYYYKLINDPPTVDTLTTASGQFYDTGGPNNNYGDDERKLWLIQPPSSSTITLQVNSFELEDSWDYLYIYDGTSVFDTLLGAYTDTTIPTSITATSGSMLIEFRSDCGINTKGWNFSWASVQKDTTKTIEEDEVLLPSGTEELAGVASAKVYPNPFSENLQVGLTMAQAETFTLRFYTLDGKLLLQQTHKASSGKQTYSIPAGELGLVQGTYLLELTTATKKRTLEIVYQ